MENQGADGREPHAKLQPWQLWACFSTSIVKMIIVLVAISYFLFIALLVLVLLVLLWGGS